MIVGIPGDVVECDVYKAASLIRWATFRSVMESEFSRKIVAFDAYGKFPNAGVESIDDTSFTKKSEAGGGHGLTVSEIEQVFRLKELDKKICFVPGNVLDTVPKWLEENPRSRIALLPLDMDVYAPTRAALEQFWDRVVKGGIVVIDDYNAVGGATRAVDEFLESKSIAVQKLGLSHVPSFFVKP